VVRYCNIALLSSCSGYLDTALLPAMQPVGQYNFGGANTVAKQKRCLIEQILNTRGALLAE